MAIFKDLFPASRHGHGDHGDDRDHGHGHGHGDRYGHDDTSMKGRRRGSRHSGHGRGGY